jgi:hypothetical protein
MIRRCAHRPRIALLSCCALAFVGLAESPCIGAVTLYVDDDAPPGGDGLTWDTAFRFLQDALAYASAPANGVTDVHIAQGVYKPDHDELHPDGTGDRNATFLLPSSALPGTPDTGFGAPPLVDMGAYEFQP